MSSESSLTVVAVIVLIGGWSNVTRQCAGRRSSLRWLHDGLSRTSLVVSVIGSRVLMMSPSRFRRFRLGSISFARPLAERERFGSGVEKADLERAFADELVLADELVETAIPGTRPCRPRRRRRRATGLARRHQAERG